MRSFRKSADRIGLILTPFFIAMLLCPAALAKDLNVLTRIAYAAFLSQQGAAVCDLPRLNLTKDDRLVFALAREYADWVKAKVSEGLIEGDKEIVLKSAADKAYSEMRQVVEIFKSKPPEIETAELEKWCQSTMKNIAEQVVGTYVTQPDVIEGLISRAK
jgi:hypothetical protein